MTAKLKTLSLVVIAAIVAVVGIILNMKATSHSHLALSSENPECVAVNSTGRVYFVTCGGFF